MVRASSVRCNCTSHNCCGNPLGFVEIPRATQQRHREDDLELELQRLTLKSVESQAETQLNESFTGAAAITQVSDRSTENDVKHIFLSSIDEFQFRLNSIGRLAEDLEQRRETVIRRGSREAAALREHISWMTTTMCNLRSLPVNDDIFDQQRNEFVQLLHEKLETIRRWEEIRYDVERKSQELEEEVNVSSTAENERYFQHSLSSTHPLVLLSMFTTIVLNVHELPDHSANFLLQMHRDLLLLVFHSYGAKDFTHERSSILKHLPKDIRTVRSRFGLEPQVKMFAVCPKCSTLLEPKFDASKSIYVYPETICTHRELDGEECGAALLKWQRGGRFKQSIQVPRRPYGYRSLRDFVGEMLSRPGIEDLLERRPPAARPDVLTDIFDGRIIREFNGPDGLPFFHKNGDGSDLYLAWAISVDWFNPYHNKIAGKSVSVGVISMVCLNLPLHMRNEISNVYLVGIIPGPREPSLHKINNFLTPIVDELVDSWKRGTRYSRTSKHFNGRVVFSVLIPLVADLPASRKVSGTTGHGSRCFCSLCLRKKEEINDVDVSFSRRTKDEHLRLAREWRDAETQRERVALAKNNGIRYSVLLDLPYWEPRFAVVDSMHNLFLGLIQYHVRFIIGVEYEKASSRRSDTAKEDGITIKKISKILEILKDPEGPTSSRLRRYSVNDLIDFHMCQKVPLSPDVGSYNKDSLILSLLSCDLVVKRNTGSLVSAENRPPDPIEENALPLFDIMWAPVSSGHHAIGAAERNAVAEDRSIAMVKSRRDIGPHEIEAIQAAIQATCRPSWQQCPPKAFGTSQQGKLKADQWRTLLEFDLPVILVEMWTDSSIPSLTIEAKNRRALLVELTMELAMAISWGTSRRTSKDHAARYTLHLQKYLRGIQKLSPKPKLVPNHHSALHIGEELLLFGPVNGWWTYPYERLIGALQGINSNPSIGEIEITMLKSYYSSARLQRLIRESDCPTVLKSYSSVLEKYFPAHAVGSYSSNTKRTGSHGESKRKNIEELDDDIFDAVCLLFKEAEQQLNRKVVVHRSHVIDGVKFTSLESERDSVVFIGNGSDRYPGIIRKIFSTASGLLFAIHPYRRRMSDIPDPFARWPDFRASLWSQKVDEKVQLVNPDSTYICHAARRPWKDGGTNTYVLRPLDRVRCSL